MKSKNTKFQYAVINDDNQELSAHMLFSDAVAAGQKLAETEKHNGFAIVNLHSRIIENWCPTV